MHNNKELFIASLQYTARKTGFSSFLIEKDYYCSLFLDLLYRRNSDLIFKGGTLLNKVYCGFYRLSEDLDFSISISSKVSRSERSQTVKPIKSLFSNICKEEAVFTLLQELKGFNQSKQYIGEIAYHSEITRRLEKIKIDIGLREQVLTNPLEREAKTILLNPLRENDAIQPVRVRCLSLEEAFAEKTRAALTRNPPAIRDLFDLSFANSKFDIDFHGSAYLSLIKGKIRMTEDPVDVSTQRKELFERQLETELRPVLKSSDYEEFNFERSFQDLCNLAERFLG